MNHRLPADVPESGKRYDLTLTGAGLDKRKRELAMFVIDNGRYKGVRVTAFLTSLLKQSLMEDADVPEGSLNTRALDALKYRVRISAEIGVERLSKNSMGMFTPVSEDYKATNVYVHYDLRDFAYPNEESELAVAFQRKDTKFARKNNDPVPPPEKPAEEPEAKPKAKRTRKPKASE